MDSCIIDWACRIMTAVLVAFIVVIILGLWASCKLASEYDREMGYDDY